MFQEYRTVQKEQMGRIQLEVKEREREIGQLNQGLADKDRIL
jgi:hypothetical protein